MDFLDAERTVAAIASYCRIEQLLFSLLGSWVTSIDDPAARVTADELADHAAWRARRWYELLPTAPPGPDAFLAAPPAELAFAELVVDAAGSGDVRRMTVVVEGLLPMLGRAMSAHLAHAEEVAQRPIVRIAAIARTDIDADLASGRAILDRLTRDPAASVEADRARDGVTTAIARLGGPFGP